MERAEQRCRELLAGLHRRLRQLAPPAALHQLLRRRRRLQSSHPAPQKPLGAHHLRGMYRSTISPSSFLRCDTHRRGDVRPPPVAAAALPLRGHHACPAPPPSPSRCSISQARFSCCCSVCARLAQAVTAHLRALAWALHQAEPPAPWASMTPSLRRLQAHRGAGPRHLPQRPPHFGSPSTLSLTSRGDRAFAKGVGGRRGAPWPGGRASRRAPAQTARLRLQRLPRCLHAIQAELETQ